MEIEVMEELEYYRMTYTPMGEDEPETRIAKFAYHVFPRRICVFTGLTAGLRSTINGAEDIIELICQAEGCQVSDMTFYDLQTRLGYENPPGHFEFDRLEFATDGFRLHVDAWHPEPCPEHIVAAFAERIGQNPYQMKNGNDHRPGALEQLRQAQAAGPKPEPYRKIFPWVDMEYQAALEKFGNELAEPYLKYGVGPAKMIGLLDALESCFASGVGRSTFVKTDRQLVQYLASWVNHAIREGGAGQDDHSYHHVLEGFVRTLVRAVRLNEANLVRRHVFFRCFELPDWFVGWAFAWHFTPGEDGDA